MLAHRLTELTLAICLITVSLASDAAAGTDHEHPDSHAMLTRAAELHRTLPGGAVVISTTIEHDGTRVSAPPTRGGFAFLREHDDQPARLRAECWSGPSGGVDMICDGRTRFLGDPLRRIYRTEDAPRMLSEFLNHHETAGLLGVGPMLLLTWLCDEGGMIQPTAEPVRTSVAGQPAWMISGLAAGPDEDLVVRYCLAAEGEPLLLSAQIPAPCGATVNITCRDWKTGIVHDPGFAGSFRVEERSNWEYSETTGSIHLAQDRQDATSPDEPVRSLIGSSAPAITVHDRNGHRFDLLEHSELAGGKTSVILFWSAGEAPDHDAISALKATGPLLESLGARVIAVNLDAPSHPDGTRTPNHADSLIEFHGDAASIAGRWKLSGLPTLVVLDGQGRVRAVQVGFPGRQEMADRLRSAVNRLQGEFASADPQTD